MLDRALQIATLAAAKTAEGEIKARIFNRGGAVNGSIGKYRSRSYRKVRAKAGRQTGYKDLEFEGDLRRSIQTGKRRDGAVVGFTNAKSAKIAGYQEDQTGKTIFKLSDAGLSKARKAFVSSYRKTLR